MKGVLKVPVSGNHAILPEQSSGGAVSAAINLILFGI
jgi:hypothetical protein